MKKKKQDTTLSKSTSKRKNPPENNQSTSIGCMSGIFHLVSKYQQRRKFITSGNTKQKTTTNTTSSASSKSKSATLLSDIKRSPTITSEIRRIPRAETITEKRRKLMESLQKCEEDLVSLKKVIESVQSTGYARGGKNGGECLIVQVDGKEGKKSDNEQPSPVSVLEDITATPSPLQPQCSTIGGTNLSFFPKITVETVPILFNHKEDKQCGFFGSTRTASKTSLASPYWSSKAKVECVNEVYREAVWEERWELERVGATLEDCVFGDLIEETVREMSCCRINSLPFEVCRRRLRF